MKLHMIVLQHVVNQFVNFQKHWAIILEITITSKFRGRKSNIVDTGLLILLVACALHGIHGYQCDKQVSAVNIVTVYWPNG